MKNVVQGLDDIDPFLGFAGTGVGLQGMPPEFGFSDDPFYSVIGGAIYGTYIPAGYDNTTPASGADPTQSVAVTSGGLTINVIYTSAALSAPQSFRDGIQKAVAIMAAAFSDKITVNITVNWSGTGGGASAGPSNGYYEPYSWVRSNLINNASPGDTTFNALPSGTSIQSQSNVAVWNAQLKLWGVLGANDTTTADGSANFATDINPNLLVGVALHELTHAMGRIPYGPAPDIFDLFRFTSAGTRLFLGGATAPAAYFSLDGGYTKLADYGQNSDASDFLNSGVQGPSDPFNEFYNAGTTQQLTAVDLKQLVALGFHLASNTPTTIESFGATKLVLSSSYYYLNPVAGGTGPVLMRGGTAVVAGQFSPFAPIGAEKTATGYDIAWKVTGADQYIVWQVDNSGNYVSNLTNVVGGSDAGLRSLETVFQQDLNSDGVIGIPNGPIESFGVTILYQSNNNYYLNTSSATGPTLKRGGAAVTIGQFSPFAPIGAEKTATGYDVAWKVPGADQYIVWQVDNSGNYVSNLTNVVGASDPTLKSLESIFQQDLNGDGVIGTPTTVIESAGVTFLTQTNNNYYLNTSGATGPTMKRGGAAVTIGQFSPFAPIGAEKTATGYDVAWKVPGADQYIVWQVDNSGNFVANLTNVVSGNDPTLKSLETVFHQDLNGDGVIGIPTTVIESAGVTFLTQISNNYYLNASSATGPVLMRSGAAVTVGQFSPFVPIGAEKTSSGYDVAWKVPGADQYIIWQVDNSGNFVSNLTNVVSGSSAALKSFESIFQQDLNGDNVFGVTAGTTLGAELFGAHDGNAFVFASNHWGGSDPGQSAAWIDGLDLIDAVAPGVWDAIEQSVSTLATFLTHVDVPVGHNDAATGTHGVADFLDQGFIIR